MEQTRTRVLAERFIEALTRVEHEGAGALDELVELFAEDAELTNPRLALTHERRTGREGVRRFWATYLRVLGEARSRFSNVMTSERAAVLFWTTRVRNGADRSGELEYDGVTLLEFDERGLVSYLRAYFDPAALGSSSRARGAHGEAREARR